VASWPALFGLSMVLSFGGGGGNGKTVPFGNSPADASSPVPSTDSCLESGLSAKYNHLIWLFTAASDVQNMRRGAESSEGRKTRQYYSTHKRGVALMSSEGTNLKACVAPNHTLPP